MESLLVRSLRRITDVYRDTEFVIVPNLVLPEPGRASRPVENTIGSAGFKFVPIETFALGSKRGEGQDSFCLLKQITGHGSRIDSVRWWAHFLANEHELNGFIYHNPAGAARLNQWKGSEHPLSDERKDCPITLYDYAGQESPVIARDWDETVAAFFHTISTRNPDVRHDGFKFRDPIRSWGEGLYIGNRTLDHVRWERLETVLQALGVDADGNALPPTEAGT